MAFVLVVVRKEVLLIKYLKLWRVQVVAKKKEEKQELK